MHLFMTLDDTETKPVFKNAGEYKIYYKIEKYGYKVVTGSETVTILQKKQPVVENVDNSWTKNNNNKGLIFKLEEDDEIIGVKINGEYIDESNYEIKKGTNNFVIVELKPEYLSELQEGEYRIAIEGKNVVVDTTFNIKGKLDNNVEGDSDKQDNNKEDNIETEKANSADTSDMNNMNLWIMLLILSVAVLIKMSIYSKNRF